MSTGLIQPVNPANARRDVSAAHVLDVTSTPVNQSIPSQFLRMPTGMPVPQPVPQAPPGALTASVAQTVTAVPPAPMMTAPTSPMPRGPSDRMAWQRSHAQHPMVNEIRRLHPNASLMGAAAPALGEWQGRPLAKFEIAANPPEQGARQVTGALRRAAQLLRQTGLHNLPPEMIGGPLAALARGGAVELHFQNGVVLKTAL
jgi:hypothetical protein